MATIHLVIKGKVQGVFYRATAKDVAKNLKLTGWIKNTVEGYVEAVVSGEEKAIEQFIEWCKRGPSKAVVSSVDVMRLEETTFDGFRISRD